MDLQYWFSFSGKLSKDEYGKRALVCIFGSILTCWIPVLGLLIALAFFVALIAATVRRLSSTKRSPILALLLIIPLVGLIFVIWLALQD
jgi:uncharacterized membrane protein YhaH (DUF805 family)